ncbi:carboxymuconolactone decarboxylase family protein [Ramlibacter tataouinensis]|uniref:carboxymuconolactone decarboxylase family protein n=1 Tax=Ramlibacter tataouinensis TaxID=94132 RepID=UPI0002FFF26A|nr:carboxymuconolactone decarboxylase family protein [Ramlibacter tataouinensis]
MSGSAPGARDLGLRGDRFPPLAYEAMTPEQRAMVDAVLAGKRGSMQGPYNVLLRSPAMGQLAQAFGEHTRFNSSLPLRLNELAILLVAREWTCQFMWHAHRAIALGAGLPEAVIDAIAERRTPDAMQDDEAAVHGFCTELLATRRVGDATFAATKAAFGERGVVDLMGTMSYYTLVAMALNVDRYPLPAGASPALG